MSDRHILAGERVTDDLDLVVVGERLRSAFRASGEMRAIPVRRELDGADVLLGYLWYSDHENAAGFAANQELSPRSDNLGRIWIAALKEAAAAGLGTSQAVDSFRSLPLGPGGRVIGGRMSSIGTVSHDVAFGRGFIVEWPSGPPDGYLGSVAE